MVLLRVSYRCRSRLLGHLGLGSEVLSDGLTSGVGWWTIYASIRS